MPSRLSLSSISSKLSLERVVCNKKLKTIGAAAFQNCFKLEDVQLASKSISFGDYPFAGCDRIIELAAAAGFPSKLARNCHGEMTSTGDGVVPYLIARFERSERKRYVLLAHMRFKNAVHAHDGTEEEKVAAAKKQPILLHLQGQTKTDEDAETVRRLQQDVLLQQAVPDRRREEAGLQQGQDVGRRVAECGNEAWKVFWGQC